MEIEIIRSTMPAARGNNRTLRLTVRVFNVPPFPTREAGLVWEIMIRPNRQGFFTDRVIQLGLQRSADELIDRIVAQQRFNNDVRRINGRAQLVGEVQRLVINPPDFGPGPAPALLWRNDDAFRPIRWNEPNEVVQVNIAGEGIDNA